MFLYTVLYLLRFWRFESCFFGLSLSLLVILSCEGSAKVLDSHFEHSGREPSRDMR
jgi:hypothetical protein